MPRAPQTFANHRRFAPGYHFVTAPLVIAYLGWSIWRAASLRDVESHFDLLGALALTGVYLYTRLFPLRAQDRIIRLEERLRLARLLPADLAARVEEIRPRQLVALRFAPDDEVVELVREVLAGRLTKPREIKQRIRNWRGDYLRV